MKNSQHQRELYFTHAHDAPPTMDKGNLYDAKEVYAKMKEYNHKKEEIKKIIGGCYEKR
jgi:hypothetical protein